MAHPRDEGRGRWRLSAMPSSTSAPEPLAQETLDERLKVYIGGIRLPSKRDADSYTHQPMTDHGGA